MKKILVKEGQSIFDIAIQEYGTVEGCWNILRDNEIESMDSYLAPNRILKIDDRNVIREVATAQAIQNAGGLGTLGSDGEMPADFNSDYNEDHLI